jgi:hypothetical protein
LSRPWLARDLSLLRRSCDGEGSMCLVPLEDANADLIGVLQVRHSPPMHLGSDGPLESLENRFVGCDCR